MQSIRRPAPSSLLSIISHHQPQCPCAQLQSIRTFTSTPQFPASSGEASLRRKHAQVPPYPYPPKRWYKQSNFGLYGNTSIQFGNTVSPRTEIKNRRKWHPNIRRQRLWSVALNRFVRVKIHARVLRTIDKNGGLDNYLLGEKAGRIKELGMGGWVLRWRIMRTGMVRERFRLEREKLGLLDNYEDEMESLGIDGTPVGETEAGVQERRFDKMLDEDDKMAQNGQDGGLEIGEGLGGEAHDAEEPETIEAKLAV
ncbi:39S ribosomal protein L24, mitochondrial [Agyrium rufum]|nr:39S ribosomal protein L24, mitochondrial [Agyrium rufum]